MFMKYLLYAGPGGQEGLRSQVLSPESGSGRALQSPGLSPAARANTAQVSPQQNGSCLRAGVSTLGWVWGKALPLGSLPPAEACLTPQPSP